MLFRSLYFDGLHHLSSQPFPPFKFLSLPGFANVVHFLFSSNEIRCPLMTLVDIFLIISTLVASLVVDRTIAAAVIGSLVHLSSEWGRSILYFHTSAQLIHRLYSHQKHFWAVDTHLEVVTAAPAALERSRCDDDLVRHSLFVEFSTL